MLQTVFVIIFVQRTLSPTMYLFTTKKHQDTHAHNFTTQFTELTYRFKDLLQDCIIYNNEPKWNQQTCIMKSIIKGNKEKTITISKILNLIYKFIRQRYL